MATRDELVAAIAGRLEAVVGVGGTRLDDRRQRPSQLRTSGTVHSDGRQRYRARKSDCDACPLRAQCGTKNEPHHIARDIHEDARDVARRKMKTRAFLKSRDQRKRVGP